MRRTRLTPALRALGTGALAAGALIVMGSVGAAGGVAGAATTTTTTAVAPSTPTDAWLRKAVAAEQTVGSVHINGHIVQGKTAIVLSLLVNGDGEGGGAFTQAGSTIQLKRVGSLLYFNAPKKYWASHANAQQTKAYGGKWIVVDALDPRFQSFDHLLNAGELAATIFEGYTKPLTQSKPTTLDGHKVVVVSDTATAKAKKSSVRMYIAASGKPYVLKIVDQGPTQTTTLAFSSFGKAVSITTPPEPINLTGSG